MNELMELEYLLDEMIEAMLGIFFKFVPLFVMFIMSTTAIRMTIGFLTCKGHNKYVNNEYVNFMDDKLNDDENNAEINVNIQEVKSNHNAVINYPKPLNLEKPKILDLTKDYC